MNLLPPPTINFVISQETEIKTHEFLFFGNRSQWGNHKRELLGRFIITFKDDQPDYLKLNRLQKKLNTALRENWHQVTVTTKEHKEQVKLSQLTKAKKAFTKAKNIELKKLEKFEGTFFYEDEKQKTLENIAQLKEVMKNRYGVSL